MIKENMADKNNLNALSGRFRGFYPVVIDVETAGFNAKTDALLEIAAITMKMDEDGWLQPDETLHFHVEPFEGALLDPLRWHLPALIPTIRCAVPSLNTKPCMKYSKWCVKVLKTGAAIAGLLSPTTPILITAF